MGSICVTPTQAVTDDCVIVDWGYLHSGAEGLTDSHEEQAIELKCSAIVYDDAYLHADYESLGAISIE